MMKRWAIGVLAAMGVATTALAQQNVPYPPQNPVPPGYGPPPGSMMLPPGPPPGQCIPPGPVPGVPGYGPFPAGGPPSAPPLQATGNTGVPPGLGVPSSYMPVNMPQCCSEPPRYAPGTPGTYTAFTEQSPEFRAHNCEFWDGCPHWYFDVGAIGLLHPTIGSGALAVSDVSANRAAPAVSNGNTELSAGDVHPPWQAGVRAEVGYVGDCGVLEFSGFYVPVTGTSLTATDPAVLDTFFVNPPPGFTGAGNNGLFTHVDQVTAQFHSAVYSGEAMFRGNFLDMTGLNLMLGARYFGNYERFQLDTVANLAANDPTMQAEYTVRVWNNIAALQFGIDLYQPFSDYFAFNLQLKTAPGANFVQTIKTLERGDGAIGLSDSVKRVQFAETFDIGLYLDSFVSDRIRVRAGYSAFWAVNVATAQKNVDYNLAETGYFDGHGSVFYHGPSLTITIRY